jgi:DNA-binding PadR family transcriptional regulator
VTEAYREEIVQRIAKNLLDIQILRLIQRQPLIWGYRIKKRFESDFHIKLRHSALYPLLSSLEQRGFLKGCKQRKGGRARKVYTITEEGEKYLQTYYETLMEQMKSAEGS